MVNILFGILSFTVAFFVIGLTWSMVNQDKNHITVRYDCRALMGNWHPDFPAEVVAECKKRIKE